MQRYKVGSNHLTEQKKAYPAETDGMVERVEYTFSISWSCD